MISTALINDFLLPPLLFFVYLAIFLFLFYQPSPPKKSQTYKKKTIARASHLTDKNQIAEKRIKSFTQQIANRENAIKFFDQLETLDRYSIYRLSTILGINIKSDEEYKPLENIKEEINQLFKIRPRQVFAAMTLILSSGNF